jgi:hypothetical protein
MKWCLQPYYEVTILEKYNLQQYTIMQTRQIVGVPLLAK